jgi:hypothetical protein
VSSLHSTILSVLSLIVSSGKLISHWGFALARTHTSMATRPFRKELLDSDGGNPVPAVTCLHVFGALYWPSPDDNSTAVNSNTQSTSSSSASSNVCNTDKKELILLGCGKECLVYELPQMRKLCTFINEFAILDLIGFNMPVAPSDHKSLCICAGEANSMTVWDIGNKCLYRHLSIGVPARLPKYGMPLVKNLTVVTTPRGRTESLQHEIVSYVLAGCAKDPSGIERTSLRKSVRYLNVIIDCRNCASH